MRMEDNEREREKVYILINGSFDLMCVRHSRFMSDTRIFVKRNARWNAPKRNTNVGRHAINSSFSHTHTCISANRLWVTKLLHYMAHAPVHNITPNFMLLCTVFHLGNQEINNTRRAHFTNSFYSNIYTTAQMQSTLRSMTHTQIYI